MNPVAKTTFSTQSAKPSAFLQDFSVLNLASLLPGIILCIAGSLAIIIRNNLGLLGILG